MSKPVQSGRFVEIDHLRGLAMFAMVLIHTNAYFLGDSSFVKNLWDYSQFAVPVFLLCSSYLFFAKETKFNLSYIWKRLKRLLIPYYIFMIAFFVALFFREPHKLTIRYIVQSIFLTDGVDLSWLVLLFVQLMFVIAFISFVWKKQKFLFWAYAIVSFVCSFLFVFFTWPYNHYKMIMWLPYSVLIVYTMFLALFHNKKWFYPVSLIGSGIIFITLRIFEIAVHHSLTFYDNKYPPNLYFLSYGIFSLATLHFIAKKGIFDIFPVNIFLNFLSRFSYNIFFIHWILLYLISWTFGFLHFNWLTFFLAVLISSLATQYILQKGRILFSIAKNQKH